MSNHKKTGQCMCGHIKYTIETVDQNIHVCHCENCQKWSGGPSLSVVCTPNWKIENEVDLTWYNSSEWAQRGFCKNCGTHLLFRTHDGNYHGVTSGSLDDASDMSIGEHIFIDQKPPYYDFADDKPRLTKEDFMKMIGAH